MIPMKTIVTQYVHRKAKHARSVVTLYIIRNDIITIYIQQLKRALNERSTHVHVDIRITRYNAD